MSNVRVRDGVEAAVFDSATGTFVGLAPGREFDANDPIVAEHGWAFTSESRKINRGISTGVEEATATPGTKRNR